MIPVTPNKPPVTSVQSQPDLPSNPYPRTLIAVVGPSGTGKSTSLRNLPLDKTAIADCERKGMPFRTAQALFSPNRVQEFRDWFSKQIKSPDIQIIVIDSMTALVDMLQTECEASYKGFDIWKYYNDGIGDLCRLFKTSGKCVVITALDEIVQMPDTMGNMTTQRRIYVQGKEWANKGIESECLAVWYSHGKRSKETGKIEYLFGTQTDGITKAKTPQFWGLNDPEPNDLHAVLLKAAKAINS
jgi:hypothetical protein